MMSNGLYDARSYAYKASHSTVNALLDMIETWCTNMSVFLDMGAAFDCVDQACV